MSKKTLIIIIGVITLIIFAVLIYAFLSKPTVNPDGTSTGTNFLSTIFPFGKSTTQTPEPTTGTDVSGFESEPITTQAPEIRLLTKVSSFPIAGYGIFMKERFVELPTVIPSPLSISPEGGEAPFPLGRAGDGLMAGKRPSPPKPTPPPTEFIPTLRYVEKATGNIYQTFADQIDGRKFTTTVIPSVYDAYFGNKGESVAMRYLKNDKKTIETFIGILPKELLGGDTTENTEISGTFLPENVSDISKSPNNIDLFYLFNTGNNSIGITMDAMANKKTQVFSSPFTEWLSWWPNDRMITLTTKPSYNVPGYMYAIDPNKKDFNKILGGINGLTTLTSPSGKLVLYANNNLTLNVFDTTTGTSKQLGVKTLPEKCIWDNLSEAVFCAVPKNIPSGQYPDSWYQGEVSLSDQIWRLNVINGSNLIILDPISTTGGEDVDAIKLGLDENENYLFFVNKKDSYLWKFDL